MPTYEYECEKCGHQFDFFQSMTADPLELCPKESCPKPRWGKGKVKRAIGGGAGLIFKGSGFYITDYRSDSYKEAAKKDTSKHETKSDSKKPKEAAKPTSSGIDAVPSCASLPAKAHA